MDVAAISERADALRTETIKLVDSIYTEVATRKVAEPPPALQFCRQRLKENQFKVLVIGEAKRGKSTFINALLGKDVLPTDVDIATSQVFQITRSDVEAYRVRFEDGSAQSINEADLPKFGSQVVHDTQGIPTLSDIIKWIEVEGPFKFLPPEIILMDTPGLGALYSAHSQITQRFIPEADAVIFVLDSNQPIVQPEVDLIKQISEITKNIMFIQTKIDQHRKEVWEDIRKRNHQILSDKFGDVGLDTRVWPISSLNLRKATETGKEAFFTVSRQKELGVALKYFLARVAGWARTAETAAIASDYLKSEQTTLSSRLTVCKADTDQKLNEMQTMMMEKKQTFQRQWGETGSSRRELLERVSEIVMRARRTTQQVLQPGGSIDSLCKTKIDRSSSLRDLQSLSEELPKQIPTMVASEIQEVLETMRQQVCEAISELAGASSRIEVAEGDARIDYTLSLRAHLTSSNDYLTIARGVMPYAGMGFMAFSLASAIALPVLPVALLIGGLVLGGFAKANEEQVERGKNQLFSAVGQMLQELRAHLFDVDIRNANKGLVEDRLCAIETAVKEEIASIIKNKTEEAEAELERTKNVIKSGQEERRNLVDGAQNDLNAWNVLVDRCNSLVKELLALEAQFPKTGRQRR